jgi:queuine tRNA-ribosyltransferase
MSGPSQDSAGEQGELFHVQSQDAASRARTATLHLGHGSVRTPAFMPVGTNATVKAISNSALEGLGIELILSNTYHLFLRPGLEVLSHMGGLHAFMGWSRNILTDSGGYQVFSLAPFRKIEEQGVTFRSHLDGTRHHLSPEEVVEIQGVLGSDILMPLDVCTPHGIGEPEARAAMELTCRWAERSKARWLTLREGSKGDRDRAAGWRPPGELFGIIQGNFYSDLRKESAARTIALELRGYAIGGLSVGEPFPVFREQLAATAELIPDRFPRYLMGIGTPEYILEAVEQGIDLFDCVFPTRTARNAQGFTREGPLSLKTEANRLDSRPIDPACACETCRRHSRAYLRHLFKTREILAAMLVTHHNLHFIQRLVEAVRQAIEAQAFLAFKRDFLQRYGQSKRAGAADTLYDAGGNAEL